MTQQFTAIEVRAEAHRHANEVEDMLTAYADLLDARERAVPVYQHRRKNGSMLRWFDCSEETFMAMEHNEHDRKHFDRRILYTHPASADAERLAEALRTIGERLSSVLCDPSGEVVVRGSDGDRQVLTQALKDLGELAAHSAQAQPPAGQFDPGRDEAIRIHPDVAKAQAIPFDVNDGRPTRSAQAQPPAASVTIDAVMRVIDGQRRLPYCSIDEKQAFRNELEAALAAQENPNG